VSAESFRADDKGAAALLIVFCTACSISPAALSSAMRNPLRGACSKQSIGALHMHATWRSYLSSCEHCTAIDTFYLQARASHIFLAFNTGITHTLRGPCSASH
jgi:hypothetical protein